MVKVSIITPVYYPDTYKLNRLARSIYAQTSKDFEWIVVCDSDVDCVESVDLLELHPDKRAILGDNFGPGTARNVGFMLSDGDIICYVDADDELSPDRVEHLIYIYNTYPDTQLLFDSYRIHDRNTENNYNLVNLYKNNQNFIDVKSILQKVNISIPLGVSHTRQQFIAGGMFQRGVVCGEDGLLWRRMSEMLYSSQIMVSGHIAGIYYINQYGQSRIQRRFLQGGFAFNSDDPMGSNGQYLDEPWFSDYNSRDLFDKTR